ncbi:MAG: thermonuclease family protein [Halioglobus sp.]|nr:thermonuclease family protein [Halioglobus sp.]
MKTKRLAVIIVVVLLYSGFEYLVTGAVNWPRKLLQQSTTSVGDYVTNPETGLGRAAEAVDKLGAAREGQSPEAFDIVGRVVRVADGDTISVLDANNKQHKVRFFGIDAPERDQPQGDAAQLALARLVEDRDVGVVVIETDDYGRSVGTVYRGNLNINQAMVKGGYAWWYRYHAPHERHLEAAEQGAREQARGVWSEANPVAPWDWRRGRR